MYFGTGAIFLNLALISIFSVTVMMLGFFLVSSIPVHSASS